jgi:SAM-dependent methyltransferase
MSERGRARRLAAEALASGDPTGWFEPLYREADRGNASVPWADLRPNPHLLAWLGEHGPSPSTVVVVGCGYGDDAEAVAALGWTVTAFDISPTAIRQCTERFPRSAVEYTVADLLAEPHQRLGRFDLVVEVYTLQSLPQALRPDAMQSLAALVESGGRLLAISRGRDSSDPEGELPWPLTREELTGVDGFPLALETFDDFVDDEDPPVRRFVASFAKPS